MIYIPHLRFHALQFPPKHNRNHGNTYIEAPDIAKQNGDAPSCHLKAKIIFCALLLDE